MKRMIISGLVLAGCAAGLYAMRPVPTCSLTRDGNIWVVRTPSGVLLTDSTDVAFAKLEAECGVTTGGN